ncbi:FAD/FMN-containing dehydrogenase [Klebsiella pneumoniae]|uniref:FAD/FMN-containing dehydrogenase n=1 Tax=Klebsiella pneumoniae TaxID=573 RepID=A0A3S5DIB8_KLEPN|nr:FAD/FMN-containing dehydrogenase [Klebsiella pneumoniae]
MTGLNQIVALGNGTVRAQAGIRLADIETAAARRLGAALYAIDLSTGESGGLYGGGFGGIGSINYGPLAAPGNVLSVKVMTVEPAPRVLTVRLPKRCSCITPTAPTALSWRLSWRWRLRTQWIERLDVFDDFADALNYANAASARRGW